MKLQKKTKTKEKKIINEQEKTKNIRIYSYNSRGFDIVKQKVCLELIDTGDSAIPIICNQENFVLKGNTHIIRNALSDFHVIIKPARKDGFEGRPVNGMFIAFPKDMRKKIKDLSPANERIQAIQLELDDGYLIIINTYFPPDPRSANYHLDSELEDLLVVIENLVEKHNCRNVLITGDMNTDFKRKNGRVQRFNSFLVKNNLESAWNKFHVDFTHEFENNGITHTSIIDHIVWNKELGKRVISAGVKDLVGNTSDHQPIFCDMKYTCKHDGISSPVGKREKVISTKMLKDNEWEKFHLNLDLKLRDLNIPECVNCRNVHCKDQKHIQQIDRYTKDVLNDVDHVIEIVASKKRQNCHSNKVVPGWSELVKPFSDDAKFWHAIWTSAGKPLNTQLHQIMKKTRNVYHFAIRKCKRAAETIIKDRLIENCATNKIDVFSELKKMRHVNTDPPSKIDGNEKPEERFAEVYEKLYNSIDDSEEMSKIQNEVEGCIDEKSLCDIDQVNADLIAQVVKEINTNKSDPVFMFNSNCIKHAPLSFHKHLANIIKCYLIHGHVSDVLLLATIMPLIKNKLGDIESSDNYRSIALSSVILKIFDWIVLLLFGKCLELDELQFAYQKNCSTTMSTWLAVESINYFRRNESEVFTCFMDMKKAFDKVKHSLVFRKLIDRGLPSIFIRLLMYMYVNQTAKVKWNGHISHEFLLLNGVKQGAVLSAVLFCVYTDDLIKELRRNRDGCWVKQKYAGIDVYADDIVLLSPSLDGLQNMVDTCCRYAKRFNLEFSTDENPQKSKTKCMSFLKKERTIRPIYLNGKALPWVNTIKHLGTTIKNNQDCLLKQDISEKRATYIDRNNELNQEFFYADSGTKIWLNNVYNCSFYGAPLWNLFSREFEKIEKSWNVSQRLMLSLPRKTHRYFIEPLSGTTHVVTLIKRRFRRFIENIRKSKKEVLRCILKTVENDCRSNTGRNIRRLDHEDMNEQMTPISDKYKVSPNDKWKINFAREMIDIKSGKLYMNVLSREEIDDMIDYVCCT